MLQAGLHIFLICVDKAGGIGQRPAILVVKNDGNSGTRFGAADFVQLFQGNAYLLYILKYTPGCFAVVVDDRTVEKMWMKGLLFFHR